MTHVDLASLRDQFLEDPANIKSVEAYQAALLSESDCDGMRELREQLLDVIEPDGTFDGFLRQCEMKARSALPEIGGELYGALDRLYWLKYGERTRRSCTSAESRARPIHLKG